MGCVCKGVGSLGGVGGGLLVLNINVCIFCCPMAKVLHIPNTEFSYRFQCNDRHQSNVILLYAQVQLPFLSTSAGIYCESADTLN